MDKYCPDKLSASRRELLYRKSFPVDSNVGIRIMGEVLPIIQIGKGDFNKTYSFVIQKLVTINSVTFNTAVVVLKKIYKEGASAFRTETCDCLRTHAYFQTEDAQKLLEEMGLVIPKVYVNPETYMDPAYPQDGGFWILEKMHTQITTDGWSKSGLTMEQLKVEDRQLLVNIKKILNCLLNCKQDVLMRLLDLYPRNMMYNASGALCYVDSNLLFGDVLWDPKNLSISLNKIIEAWSAGNPHVSEFLWNELPKENA